MQTYTSFVAVGETDSVADLLLNRAESSVDPEDVLNLQFTSGNSL